MRKKILSALLLGLFTVASTSTFVSCKDYDDDVKNLQEQITTNDTNLKKLVEDKIALVNAEIEKTNKAISDAEEAYKAADKELQKQIDKKTTEAKSARTELVELEHQMKKVSELLLYAEQYRDNKPFQEKYKKSKDPDRYLRMHETQLILYDGAERMLRKMGLDPKSVDASEIRADYEAMQTRKATLERTYKSAEKNAKALQQKMANVEQYVGKDNSHDRDQQQISTEHNTGRT